MPVISCGRSKLSRKLGIVNIRAKMRVEIVWTSWNVRFKKCVIMWYHRETCCWIQVILYPASVMVCSTWIRGFLISRKLDWQIRNWCLIRLPLDVTKSCFPILPRLDVAFLTDHGAFTLSQDTAPRSRSQQTYLWGLPDFKSFLLPIFCFQWGISARPPPGTQQFPHSDIRPWWRLSPIDKEYNPRVCRYRVYSE